ncbi:MAG: M24 family metallopeptidase [Phycisphaerales bacterium]
MPRTNQLSKADQQRARAAAERVSMTHHRLVPFLAPGKTLDQIDLEIARIIADLGGRSCFIRYSPRGYPPFPNHSCLSINDCVVHGTSKSHRDPLKPGDILSVDIGINYNGWIGDAAWTYAIAEINNDADRHLMDTGKQSLRLGIEAMQPGRPLIDWAHAVQNCVETDNKLHLIRGLGGHGLGQTMHAPPFISNTVPTWHAEWPEAMTTFTPGMYLAVEPMLAIGTAHTRDHANAWPIHTADGSNAVHYEADIIITDNGPENCTAAMWDLPDIVG